jgi:hypothetical protein
MAIPSQDEIQDFVTQQIALWNAGKREEMTALYRKYAGSGLVIEYVGEPLGDGWKTYDHMWDNYGGKVRGDVVQALVNGNEAAVHISNVRIASGLSNPSIEIYRFDDDRLHIRYFHRTADLA